MKNTFLILGLTGLLIACNPKKNASTNNQDNVVVNAETATLNQLNQMIEKEPNNAEFLFYRGLRYQDQEDYTASIADLSKSIELDSTKPVSYFNRGVSKYSLDDFEGAVADYNMAIRLKPDYADAIYNRAIIHDTRQDYQKAIEDYNLVLKFNPDNMDAMYYRGLDYLVLKKNDLACADFKATADKGYEDGKEAYQKYCVGKK